MQKSRQTRIVLGIDPGIAITGYGLITVENNQARLLACGAITTEAGEHFGNRLQTIHKELTKIIKKYKPDEAAIEELFFAKNAKTALKVGQARGVAYLTVWQNHLPVREFTPLQVKQAITGYGLAPKAQMQKMVKMLLCLKTTPEPDDVADALAIAICSAQTKEFI
jgi:crossover junction endodeoxyribonuclease RuvC